MKNRRNSPNSHNAYGCIYELLKHELCHLVVVQLLSKSKLSEPAHYNTAERLGCSTARLSSRSSPMRRRRLLPRGRPPVHADEKTHSLKGGLPTILRAHAPLTM